MEEKTLLQSIKLSRKLKFKVWLKYVQLTLWRFKYIIVLIIAVLLLGIFTHHHYNNLSYAESAYYTATLLIGEHLIEPVNPFEMVLFVLLPFFGVTIFLTVAANTLLILFTKGYRKTDWLLTMAKLTNRHTVVVGYSHLGQKVVRELLKLEQEVIIIEKDETREEVMRLIEHGYSCNNRKFKKCRYSYEGQHITSTGIDSDFKRWGYKYGDCPQSKRT